jgi:hypothetical protein
MTPPISYDLMFLLQSDPLADNETLEKWLEELRDLKAQQQQALEEEAKVRLERKAARQVADMVSLLGIMMACLELLERSKNKLPPTNLVEPLRKLQAMGLVFPNVPVFADAPPVEADYSYLFEGWPEDFRKLAEKIVRAAIRLPERLQKLINEIPEGCLINGAITSRENPSTVKQRVLSKKGTHTPFTKEERARLCQKGKDFRKELAKVVGKDALPPVAKERHCSRLGDFEAVRAFEEEWLANTPGGDRLEVVLPGMLMRIADLLVAARPHLAPEDVSRFAGKLISLRRKIPVPLAPDASGIWTMGHQEKA